MISLLCLQEFQENIADRQRDIEDNKASLTALVDESDVGEEAASLVTRLSEYQKQLSENSKCREQDLEKAMEASKTFHNDVNGVLAWLEDVESRLEVSPRDVQVPSGDEAPGPREMCKVDEDDFLCACVVLFCACSCCVAQQEGLIRCKTCLCSVVCRASCTECDVINMFVCIYRHVRACQVMFVFLA